MYVCVQKEIEGSNLPQVVGTDFLKINSPSTGRNSGDPCYSAVSASLTNSLPDSSNYLPFCHTHLPHSPDTFYQIVS